MGALDPKRPLRLPGESRRQYAVRSGFDVGLESRPTDFAAEFKPRLGGMMEPRLGDQVQSSQGRLMAAVDSAQQAVSAAGLFAAGPLLPFNPLAHGFAQRQSQGSAPMAGSVPVAPKAPQFANVSDTGTTNSAQRLFAPTQKEALAIGAKYRTPGTVATQLRFRRPGRVASNTPY